MNAVDMLLDDHQRVRDLFQEFQSASDKSRKQQVGQQILQELFIHSKLEEEIFYPAYRQQGGAEQKEQLAEAYEEHAEVDSMVEQLLAMTPEDGEYEELFQEMIENVEHHVEEEETEMLPQARELMANQLEQLAHDMMQRKEQLMTELQAAR
jgi:hemerythrin-like domain-containing protein